PDVYSPDLDAAAARGGRERVADAADVDAAAGRVDADRRRPTADANRTSGRVGLHGRCAVSVDTDRTAARVERQPHIGGHPGFGAHLHASAAKPSKTLWSARPQADHVAVLHEFDHGFGPGPFGGGL